MTDPQWTRTGVQQGVGRIALCDLPALMAGHDAGHREEIEAWSRAHREPGVAGGDSSVL